MREDHERVGRGLCAAGLTKTYGRRAVVEDVSFTVRPGEVTGFLGPNGSGKSTTMRMLVGLSRPDRGTAMLDGTPVASLHSPGLRLGALLDAGAVHTGRTVQESMRVVTCTLGLPRAVGDEWLERVGLGAVRRRRAGALSLGMRQRLGIATAFVASPRYVVLDEPMNGLDTEGIGWIKSLLRYVADEGAGVLVSTHLIGEIEDVADRVVVIDRGHVVAEADPRSLGVAQTLVRSEDDARLAGAIEIAGHDVTTTRDGVTTAAPSDEVGRIALAAGVALVELRQERARLASFVLDHTTGEFATRHLEPVAPTRPDQPTEGSLV
jgi:ABC-2 type transport system ATP-binding protein